MNMHLCKQLLQQHSLILTPYPYPYHHISLSSIAHKQPGTAEPFISHPPLDITAIRGFLLLMSDGLYDAYATIRGSLHTVNHDIAVLVQNELDHSHDLLQVAQNVVEHVKENYRNLMHGSRLDDITLVVRNLNYPLGTGSAMTAPPSTKNPFNFTQPSQRPSFYENVRVQPQMSVIDPPPSSYQYPHPPPQPQPHHYGGGYGPQQSHPPHAMPNVRYSYTPSSTAYPNYTQVPPAVSQNPPPTSSSLYMKKSESDTGIHQSMAALAAGGGMPPSRSGSNLPAGLNSPWLNREVEESATFGGGKFASNYPVPHHSNAAPQYDRYYQQGTKNVPPSQFYGYDAAPQTQLGQTPAPGPNVTAGIHHQRSRSSSYENVPEEFGARHMSAGQRERGSGVGDVTSNFGAMQVNPSKESRLPVHRTPEVNVVSPTNAEPQYNQPGKTRLLPPPTSTQAPSSTHQTPNSIPMPNSSSPFSSLSQKSSTFDSGLDDDDRWMYSSSDRWMYSSSKPEVQYMYTCMCR